MCYRNTGLIEGLWVDPEKDTEGERELIETACALLTGASEGQSPCEATATRAIIPPRCIWISAMERSICLARGDTLPPRLTAEDAGRDRQSRDGDFFFFF